MDRRSKIGAEGAENGGSLFDSGSFHSSCIEACMIVLERFRYTLSLVLSDQSKPVLLRKA